MNPTIRPWLQAAQSEDSEARALDEAEDATRSQRVSKPVLSDSSFDDEQTRVNLSAPQTTDLRLTARRAAQASTDGAKGAAPAKDAGRPGLSWDEDDITTCLYDGATSAAARILAIEAWRANDPSADPDATATARMQQWELQALRARLAKDDAARGRLVQTAEAKGPPLPEEEEETRVREPPPGSFDAALDDDLDEEQTPTSASAAARESAAAPTLSPPPRTRRQPLKWIALGVTILALGGGALVAAPHLDLRALPFDLSAVVARKLDAPSSRAAPTSPLSVEPSSTLVSAASPEPVAALTAEALAGEAFAEAPPVVVTQLAPLSEPSSQPVVEPQVVAEESESSEDTAARPARRATAQVEKGALRLNAMPWAEVHIDGQLVGNTPLTRLELPAGVHRVTLRNSERGLSKTFDVRITAGEVETRIVSLLAEAGD